MVLEKEGEDHLDRSYEEGRIITWSLDGEKYSPYNKKKEDYLD